MERLVKIAAYLRLAGDQGATAVRLIEVAGFDSADSLRQLTRELDHLKAQGWEIESIGGPVSTRATGWPRSITVSGSH